MTVQVLLLMIWTAVVLKETAGRVNKFESNSLLQEYAFDISALKRNAAITNEKLDTLIEMINNRTSASNSDFEEVIHAKTEDALLKDGRVHIVEVKQSVDREIRRIKRAFVQEKEILRSQKENNERSFKTYAKALNDTVAILNDNLEQKLVVVTMSMNESVTNVLNQVGESVHSDMSRLTNSVQVTLQDLELRTMDVTNTFAQDIVKLNQTIDQLNESVHEKLDGMKKFLEDRVAIAMNQQQQSTSEIKASLNAVASKLDVSIQELDHSGVILAVSQKLETFQTETSKSLSLLERTLSLNTKSDIRLVNASYSQSFGQGRLEVFVDNKWGTVCDDDFSDVDASVVCRMFKYDKGVAKGEAYYGRGDGPILMDNIACIGYESSLFACSYLSKHNCGHNEDVGVYCSYN